MDNQNNNTQNYSSIPPTPANQSTSPQIGGASGGQPNTATLVYQPSPSREKFEQAIMPTKKKDSIKAYYFGCAGFFPFIGLPFTYLAIKHGRRAMKLYKEQPTPGAKAHASVGLALAYFQLAVFVLFVVIMVYFYFTRNST